MSSYHHNRNDERKEEKPPYSRIFVVCSKQAQEDDLRDAFEKYGLIEDLYIPRDRHSGDSKGVAYIKYNKTSAAAAAIEELHLKCLKPDQKPVKVMIALNKNDTSPTNDEKYKRLFIRVHRDVQQNQIVEHFSNFGHVSSVHLQKDKVTGVCKGFAYVQYPTFLEAAKAFEECDKKYKPVFATPKDELKRSRNSLDLCGQYSEGSPSAKQCNNRKKRDSLSFETNTILPMASSFDTIIVTCSPQVPQKHIERLFSIVPGMQQCQYTVDTYNGYCKATITYENEREAVYAYDKINNFEFPSGEIVTIKPDNNPLNKVANNLASIVNSFKNSLDAGNPNLLQLADAIAQTSSLIKAATSGKIDSMQSVDDSYGISLPPPQPTVSSSGRIAQRCFIVCKPYPPPLSVLRDIFCRFGDLIDVCTFPNKTFGFVKYASIKAAQEAIATLNGAVLRGIHFKVLEADEKPSKNDDQKMNVDDTSDGYLEHGKEVKRIKLHNEMDLHRS